MGAVTNAIRQSNSESYAISCTDQLPEFQLTFADNDLNTGKFGMGIASPYIID
jgi:hypothetical protein